MLWRLSLLGYNYSNGQLYFIHIVKLFLGLCNWQLIVNQQKASIGCVKDIFEPFAFVHFEWIILNWYFFVVAEMKKRKNVKETHRKQMLLASIIIGQKTPTIAIWQGLL